MLHQRSIIPRLFGAIAAAVVLLFFQPVTQETAYFRFDYPPYPETFIIQLTDPARIQQARQILSGDLDPMHVMGTIIKEPVPYNPPWGFHLDPDTIEFFDTGIETCDATIQQVQANLQEVCHSFLPGCIWCPWGSQLVAEVTLPEFDHSFFLPFILRNSP